MILVTKRSVGLLCLTLLVGVVALRAKEKPAPPVPEEFLVGRHTFFDFGPPFDFYEVFSVRSGGTGASIERITVTPPGDPCTQPATVEAATAWMTQSVSELLGKTNPCTIPEKALRRELKRCKNCLVFSGADVTMAVQCGDQTRLIRMDILDRDMFDPAPKTPEHTSWTMGLMGRLDQALGDGIMERPAFSLSEQPAPPSSESKPKDFAHLSQGAFDSLFQKAPHKPSELYLMSQKPFLGPTVEFLRSSPFQPVSYSTPKYPPLARATRVAGQVVFTLDVTSDGDVSNLGFLSGQPMLQKAVESEVAKWKFPTEAAGQQVQGVIEFKMNCQSGRP